MKPDELVPLLHDVVTSHCGAPHEVTIEDVVSIGCGYRHHLVATEGVGTAVDPRKILLDEVATEVRTRLAPVFHSTFKATYRGGYYAIHGRVTYRIDGFLGESLVEIALCSTLLYDPAKPPRQAVLVAAAKAVHVGASSAILLVIDRDKQAWTVWRISGDQLRAAADPVAHDVRYINALGDGSSKPVGSASASTCRRCPMRAKCTLEPTEDPPAYRLQGLKPVEAIDLRAKLESHFWQLNKEDNGRDRRVFHPSEISTVSCDRALAYGLLGEQEKPSTDPHLHMIFLFGHAIHSVLQQALRWALPDLKLEVRAHDAELRVVGHCDGVLGEDGFEMKSIGSKGFATTRSAKSEHRKQNTVYGALLALKRMFYLYFNKETADIAIFHEDLDRNTWHELATRMRSIITVVDAKEMPERTGSDYDCRSCKYAWKCKPGTAPRSTPLRRF